jgi:oligopeptidase B
MFKASTGMVIAVAVQFVIIMLCVGCTHQVTVIKKENNMTNAPVARTAHYVHTTHGHERVDPYFWMRDDGRTNPEVIAHLKAENAHTKTFMEPTQPLQTHLFEELKGRLKKDDSSVPVKRRSYLYYTRYEADKEFPIYCRKLDNLEAEEEIILDENELAKGHEYYSLGGFSVGENEHIIAYAEDTLSRRIFSIRFLDLKTGKNLPDVITGTSTSMAWAADGRSFFYVDKDDKTLRPYSVRKHVLGTPQSSDIVVHEETDESFYVGVGRSKSRRFIFIELQSTEVSEVRFIESTQPEQPFEPVVPRRPKVEYDVSHHGDTFYIRTNEDAKNFKLMAAPIDSSADTETWTTIIKHRNDAMLDDIEVFKEHLVLAERVNGQRQLSVRKWDEKSARKIEFTDSVYTAFAGANPEFDTNTLQIVFSSLTTPKTVVDYDMVTQTKTIRKQEQILGGFEASNYTSERIWVTARDGVKVPVSIVMPNGFKKDGSAPLYQYAYGSYGYAMDPWFSASWLSLLDRGFAVAIAHIRGGEEMGRDWYDQGRLFNKLNTFTDFIDCSEHLISNGYTQADRLIAGGGSAGGLLMGAVANMRPDLYHIIYAAVPFVDVVSTMLDASIPLTTNEYDEWGNPNHKPDYEYMLSYSPYDQVKTQAYPNMIVTTGFHDSQVQYWEPMKWVARLRALKTDNHALVFETEMETGHSGASGRYKRYKNTALVYAFFMYMIDTNLSRWTKQPK